MLSPRRGTALIAAMLAVTASFGAAVPASATTVDGLDGPRGLAAAPGGRIVWAESDGSVHQRAADGTITTLGSVPGSFIAPAVAVGGRGQTWILTSGGEPGSGAASLYRWTPGGGVKKVADIGAYQATHPDPDDLNGDPEGSNPYGVAALPDGGALVADAQHNDLLRVSNRGRITLVARLLPRVVPMPDGFPAQLEDPETGELIDLPPAGAPIPSEGVATSVTVGADGAYYVGELRGFPATPGTSQIWRIPAGTTNATCDPEQPDTGPCKRFADGLTSIVDLAPAPDGGIYAIELVKASWFAWEILELPPIGGLFKVPAGGGAPVEVDTGGPLILPGGVDVDRSGTVWLAGPIFGPGSVWSLD